MHAVIELLKEIGPIVIGVIGGYCVGNDHGYEKAWMEVKEIMEKGEKHHG